MVVSRAVARADSMVDGTVARMVEMSVVSKVVRSAVYWVAQMVSKRAG
jgi:hypothetical protein